MLLLAGVHLLMVVVVATATATDKSDVNQLTLKKTAEEEANAQSPSSSTTSFSEHKSQVTPAMAVENTTKKGFYKGMSREFVNEHNKVRARYGAGPLMWDKTLALYARRWANQIKGDCDQARHSTRNIYGECFFLGTNGTAQDALCSWEKEEEVYDKGTDGCTPGHNFRDCGHFKIMVTPAWKWVGCGRAPCTQGPRQGQFFISCSYSSDKPDPSSPAASNP
jgi:hypothetical protein